MPCLACAGEAFPVLVGLRDGYGNPIVQEVSGLYSSLLLKHGSGISSFSPTQVGANIRYDVTRMPSRWHSQ